MRNHEAIPRATSRGPEVRAGVPRVEGGRLVANVAGRGEEQRWVARGAVGAVACSGRRPDSERYEARPRPGFGGFDQGERIHTARQPCMLGCMWLELAPGE